MGISMEPSVFTSTLQGLLDTVQEGYLAEARAFREANIVDVTSYEQLKEAIAAGERESGLAKGWRYCNGLRKTV